MEVTQEQKIAYTQWYIDSVLKPNHSHIKPNFKDGTQCIEDFPQSWFDNITEEHIKNIGTIPNILRF